MATPKKKHLIELMIEAGVKWPEGAEYAAQDKRDNKVYFFRNKPTAQPRSGRFVAHEGATKNYLLPSLCRNWHKTIVTREQYAEALADAESWAAWMDISHLDAQSNQAHESDGIPSASAAEWHNPPSIEQLTADYHSKAAEADRLQAVADEALKAADEALLALEKAGEFIGLVISIDTKQKRAEQPEITDWRDLRIGDVIECVLVHGVDGVESDESNNKFHGNECTVVGFTGSGNNHIETDLKPDGYYIQEFKFIRRP